MPKPIKEIAFIIDPAVRYGKRGELEIVGIEGDLMNEETGEPAGIIVRMSLRAKNAVILQRSLQQLIVV